MRADRRVGFALSLLASLSLRGAPVAAAPAPAVLHTLDNGITLVTRTDHTAPRVAISLLVRAGATDETPATAGWRRLLTDSMLRAVQAPHATAAPGSSTPAAGSTPGVVRTMDDLQRQAEALGGHLGASVGDDYIEFWAVGDSAKIDRVVNLLLDVVLHPRLGDQDIDATRRRLVERLDGESDDVALRAIAALRGQLYRDARGEPVAYGLPANGTEQALGQLSNAKIREFYSLYITPARFTAAAAGDLRAADLTVLRTALESTPARPATVADGGAAPSFATPDGSQPPLIVRQMRTPGAWVFIAYSIAGYAHSDAPALRVLTAALGELPRARLAKRLLSTRALTSKPDGLATMAFQAALQIFPRRYASELILFAQTDTQNVDAVKDAMLDEVRKLGATPLSATELQSAKNFVRGNWAVQREGLRERAYQLALAPLVTAPPDADWPARTAQVTAADVQRVAQKYLKAYAVALVMPED
ncbi:MAG TPA: insulinase family protein [Abditibacteriaceae bacterium]|nr:insulinase family protein [Abditibacteriaceae bacterium]